MTNTPNLGLPLIAAAQAQKHVTHNEALFALDIVVQCAVLDKDAAAPPPAPDDGARHIVGAAATGAWAGRSGQIAAWRDGAWHFVQPQPGFLAYVAAEGEFYAFGGSDWSPQGAGSGVLQNVSRLGVGTSADAANPFSAKLNTALWTAKPAPEGGTGDLRCTLNKEGSANVLSLLFQSGYSARAELGLVGDDDLHLKVSADGSTWSEALRISGTGNVGVGGAPGTDRLTVAGNIVPAADNIYSIGTPSRRVSTVYAATGVINTSDIRLKTDIEPIDPDRAASLLQAAKPIAFTFRPEGGEGRHFGWSAQDWRDALGAGTKAGLLVRHDPDDPDTELALRPDEITPLLHAALLRAFGDIAALTARIDRLEQIG